MNKIEIWAPRYHDKTVLVADWKVRDQNCIVFTKANKEGKLYHPDPFYISGAKAKTFPKQKNGNGWVHVIPMSEFDMEAPS